MDESNSVAVRGRKDVLQMFNDLMDTIGFVTGKDEAVGEAMQKEFARQQRNIELIASENIVSPAVMAAMGTVLTNKYAEGYPGKRYYGGCQCVDVVENIAREYTTRESVASIVENNLSGLDIDDRAAQLAYFAVMMKARQYDRRFFSRGIQPHVYAIVESNHVDKFAVDYFCNGDMKLTVAMDTIIKELHDAKEYGSILTVTPQDWSVLYDRFAE